MSFSGLGPTNVGTIETERLWLGARANTRPDWQLPFRWINSKSSVHREAGVTGIGLPKTYSYGADVVPQDVEAIDPKDLTYGRYEVSCLVDTLKYEENPGLRDQLIDAMSGSMFEGMAKDAQATLAASFTSNTGKMSVNDARALIATNHTLADGGTTSNKISSKTDRAAIVAARNALVTQSHYQGAGQQYDTVSGGGMFVIHGTETFEAVNQAIGSAVSSSQGQINVINQFGAVTVECPYLQGDDCLVSTRRELDKPWVAIVRQAPVMKFGANPMKLGQEIITVEAAWVFGTRGAFTGVVGITNS